MGHHVRRGHSHGFMSRPDCGSKLVGRKQLRLDADNRGVIRRSSGSRCYPKPSRPPHLICQTGLLTALLIDRAQGGWVIAHNDNSPDSSSRSVTRPGLWRGARYRKTEARCVESLSGTRFHPLRWARHAVARGNGGPAKTDGAGGKSSHPVAHHADLFPSRI